MKLDLKTGASVASAIAVLFASSAPAMAADKDKAAAKTIKCAGVNECKGKGSCSGADNSCGGKNECKGTGWTEAKSAKACKKLGGHVLAAK